MPVAPGTFPGEFRQRGIGERGRLGLLGRSNGGSLDEDLRGLTLTGLSCVPCTASCSSFTGASLVCTRLLVGELSCLCVAACGGTLRLCALWDLCARLLVGNMLARSLCVGLRSPSPPPPNWGVYANPDIARAMQASRKSRAGGRKALPATVACEMSAARKVKSGGRNGGRPRIADRCPCGAMTAKRAIARGHRCSQL